MLGRIHFLNGEYSRCIQLLGILSPAMTSLEYLGGSVEYQLPSARLAAIHLTAQSHVRELKRNVETNESHPFDS